MWPSCHRGEECCSSSAMPGPPPYSEDTRCWQWIYVNLVYLLYIGFDYDLQLTATRRTNDVTCSHLRIDFGVCCLRRKLTLKRRLSGWVHQSLWKKIMKPDKSQDTRWTWLQMARGPKHQHAKLWGLECLPTRSTQPEWYSRSSGQHDLSVQIWRLKRSLMAKVWLP
jgi:hypothetical protein